MIICKRLREGELISMENVKQFLELVKTDEGLARKVVELKDSLQGGASTGSEMEILAEKVLPLAKAHGLEFTVDEFLAYANSVSGELSDDDLLNVSGGISARGVALGLLFATGLSFVPTIVSSFATGGDSPMPSAPETAISQSYDLNDSHVEEGEATVNVDAETQVSSELQSAKEKVERLQNELSRKKRGKSNVSKGYMKTLQELEKAKANVERLEKRETEQNKKQIAGEMKELLESNKEQNEAVVGQVDNELEEKHEERQDEIKEQVENKEDKSEKDEEVIIEEKEEVVEEKKDEKIEEEEENVEEAVEEEKKEEVADEKKEEIIENVENKEEVETNLKMEAEVKEKKGALNGRLSYLYSTPTKTDLQASLNEVEEKIQEAGNEQAKLDGNLANIGGIISQQVAANKDVDALKFKLERIKQTLNGENVDLEQVSNDIMALEALAKEVKEGKDVSLVEFAGEARSWDGTIENLYNCLKAAEFDTDRIENLDEWQESCEKALKKMTVYKDTLQIYQWAGTSCGSNVKDYKHKAMLKTLALFAMEREGKVEKGTAKAVKDPSAAKVDDVKIEGINGLKEFVEGKK